MKIVPIFKMTNLKPQELWAVENMKDVDEMDLFFSNTVEPEWVNNFLSKQRISSVLRLGDTWEEMGIKIAKASAAFEKAILGWKKQTSAIQLEDFYLPLNCDGPHDIGLFTQQSTLNDLIWIWFYCLRAKENHIILLEGGIQIEKAFSIAALRAECTRLQLLASQII